MLENGFFKVLGGSSLIYMYVMKQFQTDIGDKLMPRNLELAVKGILGWHNAKIATPSEQLMKILLEPSSF